MLIPDEIKSQGLWWTIRYTDDIEDLGQTDHDTQEILIRESLSPELKAATFLHELGHTFNTTMNHELWDSVSMQIFQILKDNDLLK